MKLLFIFLDGVGLGPDDPQVNPLARASLPYLKVLLDGQKLVADGHFTDAQPDHNMINTSQASLLPLDACLSVEGVPQSATGQAALFTGENISLKLGYHQGPKPDSTVVHWLQQGTLLTHLRNQKKTASLLNAFPPRYFSAIEAGYRLPGVIALSTMQAGIPLKTMQDLFAGQALSADFTAEGWHSTLGFTDTPMLTYSQAGARLALLAHQYDLTIFEYWLTDIAGHHQDMQAACTIMEAIDEVLGSLLNSWDGEGLILLTSDHGNMEDLSTRHHTLNDVPLLLIGCQEQRDKFTSFLESASPSNSRLDLTAVAPAILDFMGINPTL
jgi:2,3-bisphosphoglycerate-independent phosphoglycerate mutase